MSQEQQASENNTNQQSQPNQEIAALNQKTNSIDEKLAQIASQIQVMNEQSAKSFTQQVNTQQINNKIPDPVLNPEAYELYMEQKMEAKLNSRFQAQQQQQTAIANLVSMYPELSDSNSELTKSALQTYNKLSPEEKSSPLAYKIAVQDAALNLGLLPKNKRSDSNKRTSDDNSDIGASNSSSRNGSSQQNKGQKGISQETLAFAQLLGKNVNDPEYVKRLEKAANRGVWGKFKSRGDY